MSDRELHHHLVALYGIIEDHLKATREIEETQALLISLDPKLQAHISDAHAPTLQGADRIDDVPPRNIDELLQRVHRTLGELNRQG